ncbi:HPP family protein [Halomonas sp. AOP13-D3-9]
MSLPWYGCTALRSPWYRLFRYEYTLPGATAALTAVAGSENVHQSGWPCPILPIGISCIIMLSVAITINNLARHQR